MKWQNKGHEFDELGSYLSGVETVYLWGAGTLGKAYFDRFIWLGIKDDFNIFFIDSDVKKQRGRFCGRPVISPRDFLNEFRDDGKMALLITVDSQKNKYDIYKDWCFEDNDEIVPGKNCFTDIGSKRMIQRQFLSVLMMYKYGKLFSVVQDFIATTHCTLNCNRCLNYTMFNKNKRHFPLEQLKSDVDILFSKANYVDMLNISGGEPLLHDDIAELIGHIGDNYRERIFEFLFITNGTIIPPEDVLEKLAKHKCVVRLDDYRDTVPVCRERLPQIMALFEKHCIEYYLLRVHEWINIAHDSAINFYMSEDELIKYFDLCESPCKYIKNGRLYGCNYHAFAVEAGIAKEYESDYILVEKATKQEMLEFLLGYSDKGYVDFCQHCNGYFTVNKEKIRPAEQI